MAKKFAVALDVLCRGMFVATFIAIALAVAAGAFAVGFTRALTEGLDAASAPPVRFAFAWTEAFSVAALAVLACVLFVVAWSIRQRILSPLESLRRSLNGAATSDMHAPLWGIERQDEMGALARAAERLRQAAISGADDRFADLTARLKESANRLETDLARMVAGMQDAQMQVEASSARAARASQTAIEAAGLAKEGAARIVKKAEDAIDASGVQTRATMDVLTAAAARLTDRGTRADDCGLPERRPVAPLAWPTPQAVALVPHTSATAQETSDAVLEDLIGDLDALERFARERKTIAGDQAVALTAALVEAIDRLNGIAECVSAAADADAIRKTG
jgi:HAMP domain-containing protein